MTVISFHPSRELCFLFRFLDSAKTVTSFFPLRFRSSFLFFFHFFLSFFHFFYLNVTLSHDLNNSNILHYIERCMYDVLLLVRTVPLQFFHKAVCLEGSNFSGKKLHTVLFWKKLSSVSDKSYSEPVAQRQEMVIGTLALLWYF